MDILCSGTPHKTAPVEMSKYVEAETMRCIYLTNHVVPLNFQLPSDVRPSYPPRALQWSGPCGAGGHMYRTGQAAVRPRWSPIRYHAIESSTIIIIATLTLTFCVNEPLLVPQTTSPRPITGARPSNG